MSKPILYSYWRSSCSWRVRAALSLKGIDYDYKAVNLVKAEQKADDYTKFNPAGMVPSLAIDGKTLTESLAIMEYLEETRPEHALLPKDAFDRATVRAICQEIASGIQPIQNLPILNHVGGGEKGQQWAHHFISNGFNVLEKMLSKTAGKYSFGDSVTIADCCLVPQVYNAQRFKVDLASYPCIERVHSALMDLDAFKKSHPSRQPDTPDAERATD
uniref:maleylacetoacetate isomerase n=1 Tax=Plectus sambesii TaxID=2011161 RepID=A0A914WZZ6_9BILA